MIYSDKDSPTGQAQYFYGYDFASNGDFGAMVVLKPGIHPIIEVVRIKTTDYSAQMEQLDKTMKNYKVHNLYEMLAVESIQRFLRHFGS